MLISNSKVSYQISEVMSCATSRPSWGSVVSYGSVVPYLHRESREDYQQRVELLEWRRRTDEVVVGTTSPVTAGSGVPGSLLEVSWKVSRFLLAS